MNLIQQVTADPLQQQTIILADGSSFFYQLAFVPMQNMWVFTTITYGTFTLNGFRVVNSPNLLQQYINQIPFGIACVSSSGRDPSLQPDFSTGASNLYVLSAAETAQYQTYLTGGT